MDSKDDVRWLAENGLIARPILATMAHNRQDTSQPKRLGGRWLCNAAGNVMADAHQRPHPSAAASALDGRLRRNDGHRLFINGVRAAARFT